jgi:nitrate reductase gamma subunit
MEQTQMGSLLHTAEVVHFAAFGVMILVYSIRLFWLLRFKAGRDRQAPGERFGDTSIYPAVYSMMNVAMPWAMESTRKNLLFYLSFIIFHLGVVAGIFFAFVNSFYPQLFEIPTVAYAFMAMIGGALLVSVIRIFRRFISSVLRLISSPDDYFALFTLTVWFALGVPAVASMAGIVEGEIFLVAYLFATSFFLVYVPFSKISHYLYYPFTRYYIGKTLGHRGSIPAARAQV